MKFAGRLAALLFVAAGASAFAALDPTDRVDRWWDASRAERIGLSDKAAARCHSTGCDSLAIRSCLNDTLKPPIAATLRDATIADITARCVTGLQSKK